ncbi:hypothetical protein BDK51DRAFT_29691, partial [Blyttiomyces helicus]
CGGREDIAVDLREKPLLSTTRECGAREDIAVDLREEHLLSTKICVVKRGWLLDRYAREKGLRERQTVCAKAAICVAYRSSVLLKLHLKEEDQDLPQRGPRLIIAAVPVVLPTRPAVEDSGILRLSPSSAFHKTELGGGSILTPGIIHILDARFRSPENEMTRSLFCGLCPKVKREELMDDTVVEKEIRGPQLACRAVSSRVNRKKVRTTPPIWRGLGLRDRGRRLRAKRVFGKTQVQPLIGLPSFFTKSALSPNSPRIATSQALEEGEREKMEHTPSTHPKHPTAHSELSGEQIGGDLGGVVPQHLLWLQIPFRTWKGVKTNEEKDRLNVSSLIYCQAPGAGSDPPNALSLLALKKCCPAVVAAQEAGFRFLCQTTGSCRYRSCRVR